MTSLGSDAHRSRRAGDLHPVPSRGCGLDANVVSVPGSHRDLSAEGVDVQPLPPTDRDGRIHLLRGGEGQGTGEEGEEHADFLSAYTSEGRGLTEQLEFPPHG